MSTSGFLKKPSRPPPPPPTDGNHHLHHHSFSNSFSASLSTVVSAHKSATLAAPSHRKSSSSSKSRSDYIKISECHTGLPDRPLGKPAGFKSRASTSFSSTLKPSTSSNYYQSSHQKSRSLTENHLSSTYLYLDLPSSSFDAVGKSSGLSNTLGKSHLGNNHKSNHLFLAEEHRSPRNNNNNNNDDEPHHASTVYKTVDFMKTDALNKCKVERTSGRGSDLRGR